MTKLPVPAGETRPANLSPLQVYLQEIGKYPLLSPEEEYEYAVSHFEEGDVKAAHRLITSNLRLVVKIANDFRRVQFNLLDLIQEGNYGLMQAVKKFNPYKGVKLSSYSAWWIRAFILKYLMDNHGQVKIATTAAQRKLFYNLRKETERLLAQYEKVDTKMLAEHLDVPEKDVVEMQKRLSGSDVSLDAPLAGADATTPGDFIVDADATAADEFLADAQTKALFLEHLEEFKETLAERDLEVLENRILSDAPMTLQEIGNQYGVSRERARQIEARIVKKLREFVKAKGTLDV